MSNEAHEPVWIGFDLGGTKMLAHVYDATFKRLGRRRKRTRGHEGPEAGVERMIETIEQALEDAKCEPSRIAGIGVGCPSPVDMRTGTVLDAVNLGWTNVPLAKLLQDRFHAPVAVLNDVDAGVYGEYRFGAAKDGSRVLGVFPGTGIGGGFVYEGQILTGAKSSCFEVGHVRVREAGELCGCGRRGCLETVASRLAIAASVAKAAYRGDSPFIMKEAGTNLTEIRSGMLANAIEAGDTVVEEIIRHAARDIGVATSSFVHLLSPDIILLGGGLVEALPKLFVSEVSDAARANVMPAFNDTFEIRAAELSDDASVLGAAGWIQHTTEGSATH